MNDERHRGPDSGPPTTDEATVRGLLEAAGPRGPLPKEDIEWIQAATRRAWERQLEATRSNPTRRWWPAALAACAALILVGGVIWRLADRSPSRPPILAHIEAAVGRVTLIPEPGSGSVAGAARELRSGSAIAAGSVVRTGGAATSAGGRVALRLISGVALRLDRGTHLRLADADTIDLLRGAVYIDTSAEETTETAIEVRTPVGTVWDVGTRFAVRLLGAGERGMRVRVRAGDVVVQASDRSFRAASGEELLLHNDGSVERRTIAPFGAAWGWVLDAAPGFAIEGRTLAEFLDWVTHETGWRVHYADPKIADRADTIVLHGDIGGLQPDQAAFVVLPGAGLEGELEEGQLLIRSY